MTVAAPQVFTPIVIQAEAGALTGTNLVRDAQNPETGTGFNGLRLDFSGTGYVDFGSTVGSSLSVTITVPTAGEYDLNIRYASNDLRPLNLAINGGAATSVGFSGTDPNAGDVAPKDSMSGRFCPGRLPSSPAKTPSRSPSPAAGPMDPTSTGSSSPKPEPGRSRPLT